MWDFAGLNECEDRSLFRSGPTQYTFGRPGTTVHIDQRRLPDENRPEDTGSEVWPAALALARHLERETLRTAATRLTSIFEREGDNIQFREMQRAADTVMGRSVLELGAGCGVCGLAARALGAKRVFLTDIQSALPGLIRNLDLNPGLKGTIGGKANFVEVAELNFRSASSAVQTLLSRLNVFPDQKSTTAFDLIICSDCVVWPELFGPLTATLGNLLSESNSALLSIVCRCQAAEEYPQSLRSLFAVQEEWASPAIGRQPEGFIKIFRVARRARPLGWIFKPTPERDVADILTCLEAAKSQGDVERAWTLRSIEHVLGAKVASLGDYKASVGNFYLGAHATSCRLTLSLSQIGRKSWVGKQPLAKHMIEVCHLPPTIFVKRVVPAEMPDRHALDWAHVASGYLTELNFYRFFCEVLRRKGAGVPCCYTVWETGSSALQGALKPFQSFESSNGAKNVAEELMECCFLTVLEDLTAPRWEQHLFLSQPRARAALRWLAGFHAASACDARLLAKAEHELRPHGGYWVRQQRDPGEIGKLEGVWSSLVFQFSPLDEEFFARPNIANLASRLLEADLHQHGKNRENSDHNDCHRHTSEVVGEVAGAGAGPVILHGDLRAHHLFFSTGCETNLEVHKNKQRQQRERQFQCRSPPAIAHAPAAPSPAALADDPRSNHNDVDDPEFVAAVGYRWSGLGSSVQDVAQLLLSSAEHWLLQDGSSLAWLIVSCYLEPLHRCLGTKLTVSVEEFFRQFRLACLDYAKVAIGHHLAGYNPARLRKGKQNPRRPAHNRSVEHFIGFISFVDHLLDWDSSACGTELPGFGWRSGSSETRPVPAVVIMGATGPDADFVNGTYMLEGSFTCSSKAHLAFCKVKGLPLQLQPHLEPEEIWLYLARNGTWCISSALNKEARAAVCWAHSVGQTPLSWLLPSAWTAWTVTVEDAWEAQDLKILPRLLRVGLLGQGSPPKSQSELP